VAKNWIAGAIKKPGQLHRDLGVPQGQKIPASKLKAAEARGGKVGQRARLAETLKGFSKGGKVMMPGMDKPAMRPDNPKDSPAMERRERARGIRT